MKEGNIIEQMIHAVLLNERAKCSFYGVVGISHGSLKPIIAL